MFSSFLSNHYYDYYLVFVNLCFAQLSKNPLIKTLMPSINLKCLIETDECGINRFLPSFNTSEIASTSAMYYYTLKASFSVLSSGKYCPVQD